MTQLDHVTQLEHRRIIAASRGIPAKDDQTEHWRYTRPREWGTLGALCAASAVIAGLALIGAWQLAHWCAAAAASLYAGVML